MVRQCGECIEKVKYDSVERLWKLQNVLSLDSSNGFKLESSRKEWTIE